ncbi:hypothetical protein HOLleu_08908 [Holothuria leucospilota]|uniref:Uncharacterized protein n=1 Tax=Holothuria leucospilota TaxID=206669 RepID=A0A9Q1CJW5_HOLLE|nr:hypothetical protein HOLleu_08908 [Holothuria leucospilota]
MQLELRTVSPTGSGPAGVATGFARWGTTTRSLDSPDAVEGYVRGDLKKTCVL